MSKAVILAKAFVVPPTQPKPAKQILAKANVAPLHGQRFKRCCGCKADLPRGHFWNNRARKDGLDDLCRDCREFANEKSKAKKEK